MQTDDHDELTAEERLTLSAIPRQMAPGDLLEERVVRALRAEGYFGGRKPHRSFATAWKIAAAAALFSGGLLTGRYLVMADKAQTASVAAPATTPTDTSPAERKTIPVRDDASVVAIREMWL